MEVKKAVEFVKKLKNIIHEGEKCRIEGKEYDYFSHLCFQDSIWDEIISILQRREIIMKAKKEIPICPKCGGKEIRAKIKTGELWCRRCGYIGKGEEFFEEKGGN